MSVNLYQKYRPYTLDEVIGQEYIKKILLNSIKENEVQSVYLFNGPRGTGKTSIARIFSKMINCDSKESPGNDDCQTCKYFLENQEYEDIFELDAASNNGVDDIRKIIESVKYQPITLKNKVYIIDEVHMLSKGAFNALLKTLEEPHENVIFILATTEVNKVPPTILSRCQRFDFSRINSELLEKHFKEILKKENIEYEENCLDPIIKLSDGCVRDGLSLLQKVVSIGLEKLTIDEVNKALGLVGIDSYEKLYGYIVDNDTTRLLSFWKDIYISGIDINFFITDFQVFLKNKYIFESKNAKLLDIIYKINDIEQRAVYTQNLNNLVEVLFIQLSSNIPIVNSKETEHKIIKTLEVNEEIITSEDLPFTNKIDDRVKKTELVASKSIASITQKNITPLKSNNSEKIKTKTLEVKQNDIDDNLVDSVLNILDNAKKDKRINMVKKFENIGNDLSENKKFGLAKFFLETKIRAVSDEGVVVSIESSIKESFIKRKEKIYSSLDEVTTIKILDDTEWEVIKQKYVNRKNTNENTKENLTNDGDLEVIKKLEEKLKKKIEIIKE